MTCIPHSLRPLTRRAGLLAIGGGLAVGGLAVGALPLRALAQAPSDGPLHLVVGYAPGGATDRVARITFNRPDKGNAIVADTPLELSALVERADLDEEDVGLAQDQLCDQVPELYLEV